MFEAAVGPVAEGGGGAAAVMNSFSHVNGVDMVANTYLMQTVLREKYLLRNLAVSTVSSCGRNFVLMIREQVQVWRRHDRHRLGVDL